MGLCKSKHKPQEGAQKQRRGCSSEETEERLMAGRSEKTAGPADARPAESFQGKRGAARRLWPSSSTLGEKPDVKVKASEKEVVIPQIIITRASNESLSSYSSIGSEAQRTIKEQVEWGPYYRHRNPSTVDAYHLE